MKTVFKKMGITESPRGNYITPEHNSQDSGGGLDMWRAGRTYKHHRQITQD